MTRLGYPSMTDGATAFTQLMIAQSAQQKNGILASDFARSRGWNEDVVAMTKASVSGAELEAGSWGNSLATAGAELLTMVDSGGILGSLRRARRVPMQTPYVFTASGATASWVGQSRAIPCSTLGLTGGTLAALKLATICVVSNTLLESVDPRAVDLIKNALILAIRRSSDYGFIEPSVAGTAGVTPASITSGVTGATSTGATLAAFSDDVSELLANYTGDFASSVWILSPEAAAKIAILTGCAGIGTGLGLAGGKFLGLEAIVSYSSQGSSSGATLTLLDEAQLAIADEGISVARSGDATIEMSDSPTGRTDVPTAASVNLESMFGSDATAFRAIRRVNWYATPGSVATLTMTF